MGIKEVACAGLTEATTTRTSKFDVAWTLRHTMDAMLADLRGQAREKSFDWLPESSSAGAISSGSSVNSCIGITSMVPEAFYGADMDVADMDFSSGEQSMTSSASRSSFFSFTNWW